MFIAKQEINGFIEYIVDSDDPVNAVINLTENVQVMNSTLDLNYTDNVSFRKITEKEYDDPVIKQAVNRIKHRSEEPEPSRLRKNSKRKKTASGPVPVRK